MARRTRRERGAVVWPTKDGRPATETEIRAYIVKVEAHFLHPSYPTDPHFCTGCTAPLEHEPCQVCWTHRYKEQVAKLRTLVPDEELKHAAE